MMGDVLIAIGSALMAQAFIVSLVKLTGETASVAEWCAASALLSATITWIVISERERRRR